MRCPAVHPEHGPCVLNEDDHHEFHEAMVDWSLVPWLNESYVPPPPPPPRRKTKAQQKSERAELVAMANEIARRSAPDSDDVEPSLVAGTSAAVEAGREAQMRVDAAADPEWRQRARDALVDAARDMETITADDLWERGLDRPREARAIGPVFTWAKSQGYITATGEFRTSSQVQCHGMPRRIWRSLLHHQD